MIPNNEYNVLIVEDNPGVIKIATTLLRAHEYEIEVKQSPIDFFKE